MPGFKGEPGIAIRGPKVGFIHVLSSLYEMEGKGDLMHSKLILETVLLTVYIEDLSALLSFLKIKPPDNLFFIQLEE